MLSAVWLAEFFTGTSGKTTQPEIKERGARGILAPTRAAFVAGLLAGVSLGFRSLGVAVVGGIGLTLLLRRSHKQLLWFSLAAAPVALIWLWPELLAIVHPAVGSRLASGPTTSGWTQMLCHYTSYGCDWRMSEAGRGALGAVILRNIKDAIQQPGLYLFTPLVADNSIWNVILVTLVSVAAYAGICRHAGRRGLRTLSVLPVTFLLYLLIIVPAPWTPERCLLPFLPLFFGGLWVEGKHVVALVSENLKPQHLIVERAISGSIVFGCMALAMAIGLNYAYMIPTEVSAQAVRQQLLLRNERGAFEWIRDHTPVDARIIAYRDGLQSENSKTLFHFCF